MAEKEKILYVVHCIDTEGPLYESVSATFERLKDAFGIDLKPSKETLKKLQDKEIDLGSKETAEAVATLVEPKRLYYNDTWTKIDAMMDNITSNKFRKEHGDSFGGGWIYNWFCVDHVGLTGLNPRRRAEGYHTIYDHYAEYNQEHNIKADLIQWHFHPQPIIKDMHRSGTAFLYSSIIFKILARKIIDRNWFPTVYRPGFHTERPDSNWFLEMWVPFDYGNQSTKGKATDQPDLDKGRFGDWRFAPLKWSPYHPDIYDYQKQGSCKRYITRCLNMDARLRELKEDDVRDAFKEAQKNGKALLSFTNHDFRDMASEVDKIWKMIDKVSKEKEFQDVKFKIVDAVEGMRKSLDLEKTSAPEFEVSLEKKDEKSSPLLRVKAKNDIFGPQPFLAIKTKAHEYIWENFDFQPGNEWTYTFDFNTIDIDAVEKIGVAANNIYGIAEIVVLDVKTGKTKRTVWNDS